MDYYATLTIDKTGFLRNLTYIFDNKNPYMWYRRKAYKKARWKKAETRALKRNNC